MRSLIRGSKTTITPRNSPLIMDTSIIFETAIILSPRVPAFVGSIRSSNTVCESSPACSQGISWNFFIVISRAFHVMASLSYPCGSTLGCIFGQEPKVSRLPFYAPRRLSSSQSSLLNARIHQRMCPYLFLGASKCIKITGRLGIMSTIYVRCWANWLPSLVGGRSVLD